jgi:hypothetical protein
MSMNNTITHSVTHFSHTFSHTLLRESHTLHTYSCTLVYLIDLMKEKKCVSVLTLQSVKSVLLLHIKCVTNYVKKYVQSVLQI